MTCCRCHHMLPSHERVLVGVPFANSGPGGPACYACLPCARVYVTSPLAPDWIAEEIERTRTRLAHGEAQCTQEQLTAHDVAGRRPYRALRPPT